MKCITNKEKLPKFLSVNQNAENDSCNKYLVKPYKKGEIVKVAEFEEQIGGLDFYDRFKFSKPNKDPNWFRKRFVVVYRKDSNNKFSIKYTSTWEKFDLLIKK